MKRMTVIISVVLAIAIVGLAFQITQAQRQTGQQRPGGMRATQAQAVENTWAAIAFELKVDHETLEKARPHLQKAWDDRKKVMKDSSGDFRAISDGMTKIKADLDEKLKTVLTEEQIKKLAEWEKSQQQTRRMGGGPMGGGGRGGGR